MTVEDYVWLAAYALGSWLVGFGAGVLHRVWQQMIEKASAGD